ncbi:rhamnogalacturonan lyase family protein [Halalkalibacter alkalisediminis]|uniref:Fibronectin type-III domain-containing protein n=1 Tax=Halalkalibacter alkalisediminis TaxID=935616 RepID=A0ABV6NLB4_9BACI|nr:hypothetical protein [Halalkalibacter alkalisediminis]
MSRKLPIFMIFIMVFSMISSTGFLGYSKVEAESEEALANLKFDFGSSSSPVEEGYTQVTHTMQYNAEKGFGLNKSIDQRDRGGPDDLRRDFVINNNFHFYVDVPDGDYYVKIIAGDTIAFNRTGIAIQGENKGNITSNTGEFAEYEEVISVINGQIDFRFTENGRVNGIEIIPMASPTELNLVNKTLTPKTSVEIEWDAVDDAKSYIVYRMDEGESKFAKLGTSETTQYLDESVQLGVNYSYVVTSINNSNIESTNSPELKVSMIDDSVVTSNPPTGLAIEKALEDSISFTWSPIEGAVHYYVYRAKSEDGNYTQVGVTNEPKFTDDRVLTYNHYYYKVYAVNLGGFSEASLALESPITKITLRQMEKLDRSLVAVKLAEGNYIGWRMLGTDPKTISFDLYRDGEKINEKPISTSTNFLDSEGKAESTYQIRVLNGEDEPLTEPVGVWEENYLSIPLDKPEGGTTPDGVKYEYSANDASVGDLDGDGQFEIILKWDPSNSQDNSRVGYTGNVYLDAYKLDGTKLWRIDAGKNIRAGAHYTQFLVYDFDGNGKSEVVFKTADGTIDGQGNVIGDQNADYRNNAGYILSGPEYLTVFEGETGKALSTTDYDPPRGNVSSWGDGYGNRVDRFLAGVAYLDGERPSIVMARGYYTRTVLVAYNWRDGKLTQEWVFDSNEPGNEAYAGQGNHSLAVADVDGDGKDEIIYGAMVVDHDGTGLYSTGWGHGDANHVSNLNPNRHGLEIFQPHEDRNSPVGYSLRDAETGELLWGEFTGTDVGRAVAADIDPRYDGAELWASDGWDGSGGSGLFSVTGEKITDKTPKSMNHAIWWTGDLLRELLDHTLDTNNDPHGVGRIDKWDWEKEELVTIFTPEGTRSNNWTKGNPSLQADLFGDWREEVIWPSADSTELRIYTTTDITEHRIYTLMHDPVYRLSVAWQNVAYNQPPHVGFFLGHGMEDAPTPTIYTKDVSNIDIKVNPQSLNLKSKGGNNSLTVDVHLPSTLDSSLVDASATRITVNGKSIFAEPTKGNESKLTFKFDRGAVIEALEGHNGQIEVFVSGYLKDGNAFIGKNELKVIH